MEWIKASDRFPENWEVQILRIIGDTIPVDTSLFEQESDRLRKINGSGFISYQQLEWLDESPLENKYTEEDVAKIKKESFDEGFKTCWDGLDSKPLDKTIEL